MAEKTVFKRRVSSPVAQASGAGQDGAGQISGRWLDAPGFGARKQVGGTKRKLAAALSRVAKFEGLVAASRTRCAAAALAHCEQLATHRRRGAPSPAPTPGL
jgi:hypothetical protein